MELMKSEWSGVLLWLLIIAATKIHAAGSQKKQTRGEMMAEVCYSFFGGILAYLSIRTMKDFQWKWLVITAGGVGGADILKFFSLNVKGVLKGAGKKIQSKVDKMDNI